MSVKEYRKKIWDNLVSPYIRKRDCDWKGDGFCITCGKPITYKTCHAGHFRHGVTKKTYFFEKNIHAQCKSCNFYKDGARDIYAVRLESKYGYGILQEIDKIDEPKFVWTIEKLKVVEEEYKNKLLSLASS